MAAASRAATRQSDRRTEIYTKQQVVAGTEGAVEEWVYGCGLSSICGCPPPLVVKCATPSCAMGFSSRALRRSIEMVDRRFSPRGFSGLPAKNP